MDIFFIFQFCVLLQVVSSQSRRVHMQSRIYPGKVATDAQFPYVGYLSYNGVQTCGGSIIHSRWALTAAHCIINSNNPLFTVGTTRLYQSDGYSYKVELFYQHRNFEMQAIGNAPYTQGKKIRTYDIGLIRTSTEILFYERVRVIPLSRSIANYDNQIASMVGWGWSQYGKDISLVLLHEDVPVMPIDKCDTLFQTWYLSDELHVCASNAQQQQACPSDSGGPLVSNGKQIGIASGADKACEGLKPTIYTRVSTFVPWIEQVLALTNDYLSE